MATKKLFATMLNEYLHYSMLKERLEKINYLWQKVEHDTGWNEGTLPVPFQSTRGSSVRSGALVAQSDIGSNKYVRGSIGTPPEIWGAMVFHEHDIVSHNGKIKEKTFLGDLLPRQIEDFTDYFSEVLDHSALNADYLALAAAAGAADGTVKVDRVERFCLDQRLTIKATTGYISAIDINTDTITLVTARGGSTPVDLSGTGINVAIGDKFYLHGFDTSSLSNLKNLLLSAANGGSTNIYGVSKLSSTFTQAVNIDGSTITASNILEKIFDGFVRYKTLAKVGAAECIMSYKHMGSVMKKLEQDKGPHRMVRGSMKVSEYGFTTVEVMGPKGKLTLVALQSLDDDVIMFLDWKSMKIHSNGGIVKHKDLNGDEFFTVRDENDGYMYICDLVFRGDLVVNRPCRNAIIHTINY